MKKFLKCFAVALVAISAFASAPAAKGATPVTFGLKGGVTINSLKFNESAFAADNRSGYTLGGMMKFSTPLGFGVDASLMFTRRSARAIADYDLKEAGHNDVTVSRSYIEIPVNLRWNLGLPVVGKFVTTYVATGPDFSFLVSSRNVKNAWDNRKFDFAWTFGFGLTIINKLEIGAAYGLGLSNSASGDSSLYGPIGVDAKNRFWNVTAAWLF